MFSVPAFTMMDLLVLHIQPRKKLNGLLRIIHAGESISNREDKIMTEQAIVQATAYLHAEYSSAKRKLILNCAERLVELGWETEEAIKHALFVWG